MVRRMEREKERIQLAHSFAQFSQPLSLDAYFLYITYLYTYVLYSYVFIVRCMPVWCWISWMFAHVSYIESCGKSRTDWCGCSKSSERWMLSHFGLHQTSAWLRLAMQICSITTQRLYCGPATAEFHACGILTQTPLKHAALWATLQGSD